MICRHLGALFTHLKQRCWQAKIGVCNNGKWQSTENFNSLILDVVCRCFGILIARVGWLPELAGALEVWELPLGLENVLGSRSMLSSLCSIWHIDLPLSFPFVSVLEGTALETGPAPSKHTHHEFPKDDFPFRHCSDRWKPSEELSDNLWFLASWTLFTNEI